MICPQCQTEFNKRKEQIYCSMKCVWASNDKSKGYNHPLFRTWWSMIQRCHNPNSISYKSYGAKGVSVCERWRESVFNFAADVGERPEGKTLDRIDPFGNYEPGNCRWASVKEQHRNKRNNRFILSETYEEFSRRVGVASSVVYRQMARGICSMFRRGKYKDRIKVTGVEGQWDD